MFGRATLASEDWPIKGRADHPEAYPRRGPRTPPPAIMPACKKRRMMRRRRLSPILRAIRDIRISWLTRSKNFSRSRSTTNSRPSWATYFRACSNAPQRGPLGVSSRAEPIAGVGKGGVEDGIQHLQNRLLNEAVYHHWNAQLALSSSWLGDLYSTHGLGLVGPVRQ
jgi:hypothetical protein